MTKEEFRQYLIVVLSHSDWDEERTAAELAELIMETLECHPEVVETFK